ncbi:MAG: ribonuclease E/G [Planctomycetota bacterium]
MPLTPFSIAISRQNGGYKSIVLNSSERKEEELELSILQNIYLGKVASIEADSDFAVVDLDSNLKGNLPMKNVGYAYTRIHPQRKPPFRRDISSLLWPEQELIVQVNSLNPIMLTTDLTLPGHFLVFTPYSSKLHISKKIESQEERDRLMNLVKMLDIPPAFGFIVRTDSVGASFEDLHRDYLFLERTWLNLVRCLNTVQSPSLLSTIHPIEHFIVEHMNSDCTAIWVDREEDFAKAKSFLNEYRPEKTSVLKLHQDSTPLLSKF